MAADYITPIIEGGTLLLGVCGGMIIYGALKQKVADTTARVGSLETKFDAAINSFASTGKDVAVLNASLDGHKQLTTEKLDTLKHDVKNIETSVQQLTKMAIEDRAVKNSHS